MGRVSFFFLHMAMEYKVVKCFLILLLKINSKQIFFSGEIRYFEVGILLFLSLWKSGRWGIYI